jgi:hypothetical protein
LEVIAFVHGAAHVSTQFCRTARVELRLERIVPERASAFEGMIHIREGATVRISRHLKEPFKEYYKPKIPETFLSDLFLARKIRTTAIVTPAEMRVTVIVIAVAIGKRLKNPTMTEMTMSRPGNPAGLTCEIFILFFSVCAL